MVVNTVWDEASCLKAEPIRSWSRVSGTLLWGYFISILLFVVNVIFGNTGGLVHMIFWRSTQAVAILPVLVIIFLVIAT